MLLCIPLPVSVSNHFIQLSSLTKAAGPSTGLCKGSLRGEGGGGVVWQADVEWVDSRLFCRVACKNRLQFLNATWKTRTV